MANYLRVSESPYGTPTFGYSTYCLLPKAIQNSHLLVAYMEPPWANQSLRLDRLHSQVHTTGNSWTTGISWYDRSSLQVELEPGTWSALDLAYLTNDIRKVEDSYCGASSGSPPWLPTESPSSNSMVPDNADQPPQRTLNVVNFKLPSLKPKSFCKSVCSTCIIRLPRGLREDSKKFSFPTILRRFEVRKTSKLPNYARPGLNVSSNILELLHPIDQPIFAPHI